MKILAVETSAVSASCALLEDAHLTGEYYVNTRKMHSQTLMPMVEHLLQCCDTSPEEIGLFAVAAGPGSFTGVRIGIAAVKGMALVHETPCAGVDTLEAIAQNGTLFSGIVCAAMDARRGQVYNALFDNSAGRMERLCEDRAISADELSRELQKYKKNVLLVGDGAQICYNIVKDAIDRDGSVSAVLASPDRRLQRASSVGLLGYRQFLDGRSETAEKLLPVYLRLPQAERERQAALKNKEQSNN